MYKTSHFYFIACIFLLLSCSVEDENAEKLEMIVTGNCHKIGCVSADIYLYVNTDSLMPGNETINSNVAGIQFCQNQIWTNASEVLPIIQNKGYGKIDFFENGTKNRAIVHLKNLLPNTKYYYRAYAKIFNTTYYGSVKSFSTIDVKLPTKGYVNLGLSIKWSACNVDATSPDDMGKSYSAEECGDLYLPSSEEWQELIDKCSWSVTSYNNHRGLLVTGPSGNSIFLPSSEPVITDRNQSDDEEFRIEPIIGGTEEYGCYWSCDKGFVFSFDGGYYDNVRISEISESYEYKCSVRTVLR